MGALQDLACHSFPALPLSCDFGTLDKCPQTPPPSPGADGAVVRSSMSLAQPGAECRRRGVWNLREGSEPGEGYGSWGGVSVRKAEAGPVVGDGGEPSGRGEDSTLSSRCGAWEVAGNLGRMLFAHCLLSACKAFSRHVQTLPASKSHPPIPAGWYLRTRLSWKQEAAAPAHRRPAQGPLVCRRLSALVSMGPT